MSRGPCLPGLCSSGLCFTWRRLAPGWPPLCPLCEIERADPRGDPCCRGCLSDFLEDAVPRCPRCALRLPGSLATRECGRCVHEPPRFDAAVALADYAPPIDAMVKALKFGHRLDLGRALGALLGRRAAATLAEHRVEWLVPVPLAFERHAERGFNQALEIARAMGPALRLAPAPRLLLRTRHAPPQESLDLPARRRNVHDAFVVPVASWPQVHGCAVAVVDDVMTTASTLDAAAAALKQAGARHVVACVVARTP